MKVPHRVKVLIVDDPLLFRATLSQEISKDFGIEVVGTAGDLYEVRDKILELKPDVITLDVEMPKMDGIEFLRKLMSQYPLPVIVVSSAGNNVFEALDAGAVDFVTKPDTKTKRGLNSFINELIIKIKIASTAKVGSYKKQYESPVKTESDHEAGMSDIIVAIGASTGGTEAIYSIITALPRDMPGILIVQHMPPVFTKLYADRLNNSCMLEVKEAQNGDEVRRGRVLVAAGDYHMRLSRNDSGYFVKSTMGERVNGHCPSVDVLFDSVAETAKDKAIGVILTGMGQDGAKGILNMRQQGAYTIGQDEMTSVVYGMPMAAFNAGGIVKQLPLDKIAQEICNHIAK
ncbi:MAG: chemotaxis response regulator protein-glutamate methylesterase [Eubacteriales bacterium]|nr:chemotaxis response regulator protein-glutamate methylesterase [Eubacteriales bacterium]